MNDEQRKALVDRVEETINGLLYLVAIHGMKSLNTPENRDLIRKESADIVTRLLADRAVPEPDADAVERVATDEWRRLGGEKSNGSIRIDDYQFTDLVRRILAAAGDDLDAGSLVEVVNSVRGLDPHWKLKNIGGPYPHGYVAVFVDTANHRRPDDHSDFLNGTGPTRKAAVLNAVAKAKGASDDTH